MRLLEDFLRLFSARNTPSPRRRTASNRWCGIDGLEQRLLPTVDLALTTASAEIKAGPQPQGVQEYEMLLKWSTKNLGDEAFALNGDPLSGDDNIKVRVYGSKDLSLNSGDTDVLGYDLMFNVGGNPTLIQPNQTLHRSATVKIAPHSNNRYLIFKVDPDNKVIEPDGGNNVFVVDVFSGQLKNVPDAMSVEAGVTQAIAPQGEILDVSSTSFTKIEFFSNQGQEGDRFVFLKSGKGQEKLRIVGDQLKYGKEVLAQVIQQEAGNGKNVFVMSLTFTAKYNRAWTNHLLQQIAIRPGKDSTGVRTVIPSVYDESGVNCKPHPITVTIT